MAGDQVDRTLGQDESIRGAFIAYTIVDNTAVRFALTSTVWYYDRPRDEPDALSTDALSKSLQKTLNAYPQWAGQLRWIPCDPERGQRYGRVCIEYGTSSDPGVELVVARSSRTLASLVPESTSRIESYAGRPWVSVQLTMFACGGTGVALRMAHAFVKDWAAVHRALLEGRPLPSLSPFFNPSCLDRAAAGDISGPAPDSDILRISRSLPMAKYDWWISAPGCPATMCSFTEVPPELQATDLGPPGDPAPWHEWDGVFAPVAHYLLYFTPAEVQRIWADASASAHVPAESRVSRLDALLAFVWKLLVHARGLQDDPEPVCMIVTIGVRARLAPPLPDSFLDSPIVRVRVSCGPQIAASTSDSAVGICSAVARFTPEAIAAFLHELTYEVNPQRFWRAFLERRPSIVTSWQNLGVYELEFAGGMRPRDTDPVMPSMDGCIHIMEAHSSSVGTVGGATYSAGGRWYDEPVCLSLHLAADVMRRLLKDPELRKYRNAYIHAVEYGVTLDSRVPL
ncbi:hypothetical protein BV20DRAFT_1095046 [Pilatotrama ljubarskyi]|nr:hypothetical protein BV20DRAFT_1095046 [Pilatotrama ljubarskyi]